MRTTHHQKVSRHGITNAAITTLAIATLAIQCHAADVSSEPVKIGSKTFTESVILGEIAAAMIESTGTRAIHRAEFGGTQILFQALKTDEIDLYPEYTGTITHEIFAGQNLKSLDDIDAALAKQNIKMTRPLGFNNTYALGMTRQRSSELGINTISDLKNHPDLRFGFSNEFLDRDDGWPALKKSYNLPQLNVAGLEHALAYRALQSGALDVMDLYTTDAEIAYYDLHALTDDRDHFPEYYAVYLYRTDLETRDSQAVTAISRLATTIDNPTMTALNARAKLDRVPEAIVANDFLNQTLDIEANRAVESRTAQIWRNTKEHLFLVSTSTFAAILVAIPIGVIASKRRKLGQALLAIVGILQTIPSLALLVLLMPILAAIGLRSVGDTPAIIALFVYSLLPIVRNTHAGLVGIPAPLRESADALGLSPMATLFQIELPLAARSILAGVKIAAVVNVGFATLGALIAAGGYGQPILTGIRLNDHTLILQGAIPAAMLAILTQTTFDILERFIVPAAPHK